MKTSESIEMYLETILLLSKDNVIVRSIDVAKALDYSKPSISRAIKLLKEEGLVSVNDLGHLSLTDKGLKKANSVYERHQVLTTLFTNIGADAQLAEENACRMEHVISDSLLEIIKTFNKNYN